MGRLDVRCNVSIPVTILTDKVTKETETKNIGLKGALLRESVPFTEKEIIRLKARIPELGEFQSDVRVVRKDQGGIAVRFLNIDPTSRHALWNYIKGHIHTTKECPFCGFNNEVADVEICKNCGLPVNVTEREFHEIEKEIKKKWLKFIDNATEEFIKKCQEIEDLIEQDRLSSDEIYLRLKGTFNEFVDRAELFETGISDRELIERCRKEFHEKTNHLFIKSYAFNRTRTWPKGYQGDYKTLEGIYRNTPLSRWIGYYMDYYALNTTLAKAVRNRLRILTDLLRSELEKRKEPRVLNIACGSCRELMDLIPQIEDSQAKITCIDTDEDALSFAYNRLSIARTIASNIEFRYYNALRLFDYEIVERDFPRQDIIYSVGLFDYLETDTLIKILRNLYRHLNKNGLLIAAFKDVRQYRPQPYHWFMDWTGFLQRNEEDFLAILKEAEIPDGAVENLRDDTRAIIFYRITKI